MNPKKIVLIGGPGTGKSTVIQALEKLGYHCFHEISRDVTLEARKKGIEQLFLTQPLLFSEMLMKGRVEQFKIAESLEERHVFFDRGLPDITAYMDYMKTVYPHYFIESNECHRYDAVFCFPLWEDIYQQDNERYESFSEATKIQKYLVDAYTSLGYTLIEVPKTTIEERVKFIENHLKSL